MNAQTHAAKLREAYTAWNASKGADLSMWDQYTTDDLRLCSIGRGKYGLEFSCTRHGRAEMHAYLKALTDAFEMQHWTLQDTISEGDRVVGIGTTAWTHKTTGKRVETPVVVICRFRDGLVCEYEEFYDTAAVAAAAN